jgi:peptidoglycan/xylan/chitin deacetylase (PgdA/CDA1 family)
MIKTSDLFINQEVAYKKIAALAKDVIKEKKIPIYEDKSMFEQGIAPTAENFKYTIPTQNDLIIKFIPSQISSTSQGEIEVAIPISSISNLLKFENKNPGASLKKIYKNKKAVQLVSKTRDITKLNKDKVIMFTFDDGPSPTATKKLLEELRKREAKVTFFVLGNNAKENPDLIKEAYQDGHTVASHSYDHKDLANLNDSKISWEFNATNDVIRNILNINNTFFRPPYGSSNKHIFEMAKMNFIYWDVDPLDWKFKNSETVYKNIMKEAKNRSIVLVHDIYETSVDGALKAIDELLKQGYSLVSADEAKKLGLIKTNGFASYYDLK